MLTVEVNCLSGPGAWSTSALDYARLFAYVAYAWMMIINFSTFVIAVLNTSPKNQTLDILLSDVFIDQVRLSRIYGSPDI